MATKKVKFEDQMERIGEIVSKLDAGECDLDGSLKLYEEGIRLVRACTEQLETAEQKVKLLQATPDGNLRVTDFDADGSDGS